jgi:N-acetylmuramoyl-L-alanine amidase
VAIDPGHGGRDPGAVGIGGLQEKTVVTAIANRVAQKLQERGYQVVITRPGDREVDLEPRVAVAERADADLFVSIHANAISLNRPEVNGVETYYYSDTGRRFADQVHRRIIQAMNVRDRGIKSARFYVLRNTSMPAILIETGFVTGAEDARNLSNPTWRNRMADTIAQGIAQYAEQNL